MIKHYEYLHLPFKSLQMLGTAGSSAAVLGASALHYAAYLIHES